MDARLPLIDVDEFAGLSGPHVLVVDCRFVLGDSQAGYKAYLEGHLPGAVYANLDTDLSDLSKHGLGRHPLPEVTDFARVLGRWGWQPGMRVVVYDAGNSAMAAARLWWMLGWVGINAQVLNGGLAAWQQSGRTLQSGEVTYGRTLPQFEADMSKLVYADELKDGLQQGRITLIDARAAERYRGEVELMDARAGHVPGALNRPLGNNLAADGVSFKSAGQLYREFELLLDGQRVDQVVHMCGSGVTACHNLLAMEVAGLHGSRLYAPSWSGWSSDSANQVATGQ